MAELLLVGVDGSEASRRALYFAAEVANRLGADLLVAHVVPDMPGGDLAPQAPEVRFGQQEAEVNQAHAHLLEPLVTEARDRGVYVELKVLHGDPATALADLAVMREARQIFIGRTGHTRMREFLFGSVPATLSHKATVPVTLVP